MKMVATYRNALTRKTDVQSGLEQTHQGGEAYRVDKWKQLRRFLILGSVGGTFYVDEKKLTGYNIDVVKQCLDENGHRVIAEAIDISDRGLAPSNEPALVVLSMAASYVNAQRSEYQADVRRTALEALSQVARMSTHLFHFVDHVDKQRGWGSGLRKGIAQWYLDKDPMQLAQQITKYVQRDGWSHADLLRKTHPVPQSEIQDALFKYAVDGELSNVEHQAMHYLEVVERVKTAPEKEVIALIEQYNLPREVIPTSMLNSRDVFSALLLAGRGMPYTAMLRNLGKMSSIGLLEQGTEESTFVINRLDDFDQMKRARIHPIDVLKAKLVYERGSGVRGSLSWNPTQPIVNALERGFYTSFGVVTPTNKRGLIALDVSGSMMSGDLAGVSGLTPRVASGVLAMVTARVERDFEIVGFQRGLVPLNIRQSDSLSQVIGKISGLPFGGTDCAAPMHYALTQKKKFDYFAVYTDSETGGSNPSAALREYRKKSGVTDAKLIVNAMVSSWYSIADPNDPLMLDVVGFDSSAPQVMSAFIRGEI
jgi:60 kDa SS-A/Ro ribonucleoprotein